MRGAIRWKKDIDNAVTEEVLGGSYAGAKEVLGKSYTQKEIALQEKNL